MKLTNFIKQFIPPILWRIIIRVFGRTNSMWFGDFKDWESASLQCAGYDEKSILEKCKVALLDVKNRKRIYERDSVLYNSMEYSWPIATMLLKSAHQNNNTLRILDFGGSLGSTFYQNRGLLGNEIDIKWGIVEQRSFVETGKKYFEDNSLRFFYTHEECMFAIEPQVILLSSVLQYLPEPYVWLEKLSNLQVNYLILDRTSFSGDDKDLLTIQNVPEEIYKASYPCWFLSMTKVKDILERNYTLFSIFDSYCENEIVINKGQNLCQWKGMIWKKII
jgi:putative methyltransferase (TIGR04325 family)